MLSILSLSVLGKFCKTSSLCLTHAKVLFQLVAFLDSLLQWSSLSFLIRPLWGTSALKISGQTLI